MVTEQALNSLIKEWVTTKGQTLHSVPVDVKEDTDLIASGALDSMGFIELLLFVESITGQKIDLSDLDPNEFTTIQGLSQNIVNGSSKSAA